jgi:prevent-host-death family protein
MSEAIPADAAAERLEELVQRVARDHDHVVVTSEKAAAVLIGVEDVETLEILSDSQLMDDIRASLREIAAGETYSVEEIYPDAVPGPSDQEG